MPATVTARLPNVAVPPGALRVIPAQGAGHGGGEGDGVDRGEDRIPRRVLDLDLNRGREGLADHPIRRRGNEDEPVGAAREDVERRAGGAGEPGGRSRQRVSTADPVDRQARERCDTVDRVTVTVPDSVAPVGFASSDSVIASVAVGTVLPPAS